jgi:GNAT superfamily N-acetyltransferase
MIAEKTTVVLKDAPQINGLQFRLFRGEVDFPEMVAAINAAKLADGVERSDTVEDIRKNYAHLSNCDPFQDVLLAEVDERVVGYSRVTWYVDEHAKARIYVSFAFIHPDWRRKGIGRAMLHHNQARLSAIAAGHPDDMPRFFESFGQDSEKENERLLLSEGYQPVRHGNLMVRPNLDNIPDLPLPEGLEVHPVLPEHHRKIWDAAAEAFRDHWGYAEQTEEDYQSWQQHRNTQPEMWEVAWDGDEVAGSVQAYIDTQENEEYQRKRGWTEGISTRRPYRKQGLAAALMARSLRKQKSLGMTESALGVDTQNLSGALRLYEKMGFRMVHRSTTYRKPF